MRALHMIVALLMACTAAMGQGLVFDDGGGNLYTSPSAGTTNPLVSVANGAPAAGITNITGTATLAAKAFALVSASCTVTLPAATGSGATYTVKNIASSGNVTLAAAGADTVDGDTGKYFSPGTAITVVDGAAGKWYIR